MNMTGNAGENIGYSVLTPTAPSLNSLKKLDELRIQFKGELAHVRSLLTERTTDVKEINKHLHSAFSIQLPDAEKYKLMGEYPDVVQYVERSVSTGKSGSLTLAALDQSLFHDQVTSYYETLTGPALDKALANGFDVNNGFSRYVFNKSRDRIGTYFNKLKLNMLWNKATPEEIKKFINDKEEAFKEYINGHADRMKIISHMNSEEITLELENNKQAYEKARREYEEQRKLLEEKTDPKKEKDPEKRKIAQEALQKLNAGWVEYNTIYEMEQRALEQGPYQIQATTTYSQPIYQTQSKPVAPPKTPSTESSTKENTTTNDAAMKEEMNTENVSPNVLAILSKVGKIPPENSVSTTDVAALYSSSRLS